MSCSELVNVDEFIENSMSSRVKVFLETTLIGLISNEIDRHVINMIVIICKWELWKRRNKCVSEISHKLGNFVESTQRSYTISCWFHIEIKDDKELWNEIIGS